MARMSQIRGGLLLVTLLAGCVTQKPTERILDETGVLHLHTTRTEAYCKGVAPRHENLPTAQPWSTTLYIRTAGNQDGRGGAENDLKLAILDSLRTDDHGQGRLRLPPGTYILIDHDRATDRRYHQLLKDHAEETQHRGAADKDCLDKWMRGPFALFTITAGDTTMVEHHISGKCPWSTVPCAPWNGPLPP